MSALGYLLTRSFVNAIKHRLKRLRQPKYLFGAVLAGAYIYFYFYRFLFAGGRGARLPQTPIEEEMWRNLGSAMLLVATLALAWILPSSRAAITFTEAEIAFLFPAPLTRRTLIVFKLLRSQIAFLFVAIFFTFITGRWRSGVDAWTRMGSWWLILNTLSLHRICASFALSRLHARGLSDWKRRIVFAIAVAGLSYVVWRTWESLPAGSSPLLLGRKDESARLVNQIAGTSPLHWLLAPFRLVVAPYFSHGVGGFLATLPAALGILAAHFFWVIRADRSFEDAAIETARRRAVMFAAAKKGEVRMSMSTGKARTPVFRLRPTGLQATAFLWKSFIRLGGARAFSRWTIFFTALGCGTFWLSHQVTSDPPRSVIVISIAIGAACYLALILSFVMVGQQAAGHLRQGIAAMDLLKTYPLPGWQFALGELLGPVIVGTLIQWATLGVGTALALAHAGPSVPPPIKQTGLLIVAGVALFLPLFNLGTSILPAAAALAFPTWVKSGDATGTGGGGLEVMGLRLLVGISQLLVIAVSFVPVAFFGAAAWFVAQKFGIALAWQAGATAATAAIVVGLEAACGIALLGWLFDRFDLGSES